MIHSDFFDVVKNKIREKLTTFHKEQPLKAGIPRQELRSTVPGGDKLFKTVIEIDTKLRESPIAGLPITRYRPGARGSQQYRDLAQELMEYVKEKYQQAA